MIKLNSSLVNLQTVFIILLFWLFKEAYAYAISAFMHSLIPSMIFKALLVNVFSKKYV